MAIATRVALKVNPNERPSQMLQRFEVPQSDGGPKITEEEAEQLHVLYRYWARNNFARLRMLPENSIFAETSALKKIYEIPSTNSERERIHSPMLMNASSGNGIGWIIVFGLILFGGMWCERQRIDEANRQRYLGPPPPDIGYQGGIGSP
ncbi:MAG: hypothetical protein HY466_01615 [Deltaproteobacteria bacterium]|nr:hypothetical protein [Deltaproteobacteria bacterium]